MAETGLHSALELRLAALARLIAKLRQTMRQAKGIEKIEEFDEIEGLERRYKVLEDQLRKLNGEGPGFRQDMKAEIEKVADDLTGMVEEFVTWVDSGYQPDLRPKRLIKS
jgi:hypothetical protein